MEARQEDALRRIFQADKQLSDHGQEPETFYLRHSGSMQSDIEHRYWDRSWAVPSEQTIDDLEEMGYLRVEPHHNKERAFALTVKGRKKGADLAGTGIGASPPTAGVGASASATYSDEDRRRYAKEAQASEDLAITSFLGRVGRDSFTPENLVQAVAMPKFDITAAVQWLRTAHSDGKVIPSGGGWRVNTNPSTSPTFHVRIVPAKARDQLSGPIYALDLSERQVLELFVEPYQERDSVSWGDRTLTSYRKPKIGKLFGSGGEMVASIRENLRRSSRSHAANHAEELFFEKTVQDVTDQYITPSEPVSVESQTEPKMSPPQPGSGKAIFVVHGHARKDEVARFLEQSVKKFDVVVLGEKPSRGRTIIEKFEDHGGSAAFAVVLLTADDVGAAIDQRDDLRPRARQNAVLELGYFLGRIGRENVAVLYEDEVELPSDYAGVEYIPLSSDWKLKLASELRAANIPIDL